jgi:hypothetical protein
MPIGATLRLSLAETELSARHSIAAHKSPGKAGAVRPPDACRGWSGCYSIGVRRRSTGYTSPRPRASAPARAAPPANAIAISDKRPTNIEAETIARLPLLPELVEPSAIEPAWQPSQAPAAQTAVTIGDRKGRNSSSRMLGLQAIPSPLYRATVARIADAAAGAGGGEPSRLQRLWCQE